MSKISKIEQAKANVAKKRQTELVKRPRIQTIVKVKALQGEIIRLNETIERGIKVTNLPEPADYTDKLEDYGQKIAQLTESIRDGLTVKNLSEIKLAKEFIVKNQIKEIKLSNLKDIPGFDKLKPDFEKLNIVLKQIKAAIGERPGQKPEDYVPVRIVVQPNQQLEFLKLFPIPSFGGSGGTTSTSTPDKPIDEYAISDIDESGTTTYFGFLEIGGAWYIMREIAGVFRYSKGSLDYSDNWSNRAVLTYNLYDLVF